MFSTLDWQRLQVCFKYWIPETLNFVAEISTMFAMEMIMLYVCVISVILAVSGLYYCQDSILVSVDYGWKGLMTLFLVYKIRYVVFHSNNIWNCLSITRYNFTSHCLRSRHVLDSWRERSVLITNTMAIMYLMSLIFFTASSLILSDNIMTAKNRDGSVNNYRHNILNLHLIVTDEMYNSHYNTFYFVELFTIVSMSILFFMFNFILVTLCLVISCQMQMVNTAFESVGNQSPGDPIIGNTDEIKNISNKHDLIYDELISIIVDHQAVMKKYYELLTLFKRIMLLQVFNSSILLIAAWFIFLMKDSVIFALYSSNWTEMNMKCKKLVLLAMKMNKANQKKLKFTRTKVVNLELFYKIICYCYTVLSVLINYIKVKYEQ